MTAPEQIVVTQADIDAARSIAWVPGVIGDEEAIAEAFARHQDHRGANPMTDNWPDPPNGTELLLCVSIIFVLSILYRYVIGV